MSAFSMHLSKSGPIAIADIQSGSVSIAIALNHKDAPTEILAVGRSDLSFENRSREAAIAALPEQIAEAGRQALEAYAATHPHAQISDVFTVINTPWVRSQTIRTIAKTDAEVLVTRDMIDDLARQALDQSTEVDVANLLEANVVRVELNGYVTAAPVGKHAHKISVYALISDCLPEVRSAVDEGIQKLFPSSKISYRSQLRTVLSVTEELSSLPKDYCLLDIARDATIIANIHTGRSMAHQAVDQGLLSIVKRVAGKGLPEETLALLRMTADETCSTEACNTVLESTARAEPEIVRIFADAMAELVATRYLPPFMVILCDNALAPWLTEVFSRIDFTQFTTTTRPFTVAQLNEKSLKQFVSCPPNTPVEQRLLLAASLVHIEPLQN